MNSNHKSKTIDQSDLVYWVYIGHDACLYSCRTANPYFVFVCVLNRIR